MHIPYSLGKRMGEFAVVSLSLLSLSLMEASTSQSLVRALSQSQVTQDFEYPHPKAVSSVASESDQPELLDTGNPESESPIQILEGEGEDFTYQIWQDFHPADYYLFIWDQEQETDQEPSISYNFESAAEAVNFFTCRYARERLAACTLMVSSVSYDVPETCAFPWIECDTTHPDKQESDYGG